MKKICKICWNNQGWKRPSGSQGKSSNSEAYESLYGYGHEEWLFDKSKIVDGYHYAFLQPLNVKSGKHFGKIYDILLFTILEKRKYYIGEIKQVECITSEESERLFDIYKKKGWHKEMIQDLKLAGVDTCDFLKISPKIFFNIRFKFQTTNLVDELEQISEKDINITTTRYKLLNQKTDILFNHEEPDLEGNLKNTSLRKKVFKGESEFDPYHDKIQNSLFLLLKNNYNNIYKKIFIEKDRVDIKAVTLNNEWHYFEIKTDIPRISIRKALGQILDYAYWPNAAKAQKLIIVSDCEPDVETKQYLNHIRNMFNLPLEYRYFDINESILSNPY